MNRVDFRNVGQDQVEGLIVMSIDDGTSAGADLDSNYDAVVLTLPGSAISNARPEPPTIVNQKQVVSGATILMVEITWRIVRPRGCFAC